MKATLLILSIALFASAPALAGYGHSSSEKSEAATGAATEQATGQKLVANVQGMVCKSCSRKITRQFEGRDEVESIDVAVEDGLVTIQFKEGQNIPDEEVIAAIEEYGYNTKGITRSPRDSAEDQDS